MAANSALFSAAKQNKYIMISTLIGVFSNISLNFLLIPILSIYGACIATIVSSALICIYRMIAIRRIIIIDTDLWKWIVSVILVGIVAAAAVMRMHEIIQALLCAVLLIFMYRTRLMTLIKEALSLLNKKKKQPSE